MGATHARVLLPYGLWVYFRPDGHVNVVRNMLFRPMIENEGSVSFEATCFVIEGDEFYYDTWYGYKDIPKLKAWLVAQNLFLSEVQFLL